MAEQAGSQSAGTSDGTFKGFERCLPENCVEYMLFIIDSQLQPQQIFSRLETVRKAAVQLSSQLTSEYIWQRDAFGLEVTTDKGLVYLHGITDYGDSIEDEWLIVYILRELTQKFPDLWVRVSDSDGEFLLVEAANVLPKWLSPENDANRAWVHGGQLRIIPLTLDVRSSPEKNMMLSEAVGILQSAAHTLIHSPFVEAEAFYRLEKYPAQIQDSIHHAVVSVPRRLAYLIHEVPKAIAPAVEAFYLRDPIAMKPLTSSSADLLIFPPRDFVDMSVKFTKVLYAQLKSQVFPAPSSWNDVFVSSERQAAADGSSAAQKKHAMLELGMKVTCGFEMLAKTTAKNNNRAVREIALLLEDLAEDGDSVLPKDADIASWKDCTRDDDDSWMDIDFQDFDKELDGRRNTPKAGAFGDASAHADLRRIVSRFEAFLNDDSAGLDGAEHDEMDEDDEDEDDEDYEEDTDSEDREISFDEEEFARMMREMMGLPVDANKAAHGSNRKASVADVPEVDREDEEIMQLSKQMELELNEHGALALDPRPEDSRALKDKGKNRAGAASGKTPLGGIDDDSESDEVDIDYNLAKNILESFKGQAGMAGPVGTMLAGMGIRLPRDEGEDEQSHP
ncbi:hypothetical protein N8I77_003818 [Diaporthe amygdali]|uniref:Uncharacterized protein n=1 Tax=Phomopsis amygdali TaxID=1214568 RepID=A0AAD9SKR5_PHOAM|nr:hypothetical protein N8I77_003818 [Diaporthe amygdali]